MSTVTKVLLADDDKDDREIFSEALALLNANVVYESVEDGKEAIAAVFSNSSRPNIIFLDINMPIMSGWDVLKKLKSDSQYADIPVIVYSTSSGEKEKRIAFELGALCFVTKPESLTLIKAMLEVVISKVKDNDVTSQMCMEIQTLLRKA